MKGESAESILGQSFFDTDVTEWRSAGTAYRSDTRLGKRFHSLADKDPSFVDFLHDHRIDLNAIEKLSANERAPTLRKATSIVAIRDAVLSAGPSETGRAQRRSREVLDIYSGATAMFAMVEGNPRWFKAIIGELLDNRGPEGVTPAKQARAVTSAGMRFRALLSTIPCPPVAPGKLNRGVLSLLDRIGNFFASELTEKPFTLDPPNSFVVNKDCPDDLIDSLGQAVNVGALVLLPDSEDSFVGSSLRGKRLRLSYIFGPYFPILLRAGRAVNLSLILDRTKSASGGAGYLFS